MKFYRGSHEEELGLNLAPLIDVVFLLLIFFMVTTSFVKDAAIDLTLPEASSEQTQAQEFIIRITVNKLDEVTIAHGNKIFSDIAVGESRDHLRDKLKLALEQLRLDQGVQETESPTMVIEADKAASHGRVIGIMDALSRLGIRRIQFAVADPEDEQITDESS